ncbi:MAG TPA: bifunctional phosphopantothenoylcysteine decarboxylase/phosphopantothenate--cysteine ligase CoaBC [Cellvibrionaceae bacterium]|nr:bifunctional phosphopantothenoylcysteine decarboxylase/phosphopantothenate--cysteine ligase CoaBC [Cellvibrionaceae bacterium]HMY40550.1 bifunctional phosphopantothenoylcysteine decarboxylase/phosphopantothenate--cysteine ligase CoaBC [Marinagarivorans sp.]HNG59506.1 bifunctional phosphopantothenoylcysteine decarboxylase/phosphopantothenate--cysteine ligase CoaBC [Cellvibrionaceae bacterium]
MNILLGISGGIAAYKAAELTRLLKKHGAQVRVVMTPAAQEFITPLTLQALSGEPVHTELLNPAAEAAMGHIELARWADAIVIAPASADVLARLSAGMANDLLTTLCLASTAPLFLAPAMNQAMWRHPATQANCAQLQARGTYLLGPAEGEQACGDTGPGRMLEPSAIVAHLVQWASAQQGLPNLTGQHWLITAGPTREALDPVRYLTNHSSGKMGYALADAAARAGARVTLVSGPTALAAPPAVQRIDVQSALEMLVACDEVLPGVDVVVAAAAVADYRPAEVAGQKIKKSADALSLALVKNPDILAHLASRLRGLKPRCFVMGFAAETQHLHSHAQAKLQAKGLDAIAANDVSLPGLGFNSDNNALLLIDRQGSTTLNPRSKGKLAEAVVAWVAERFPHDLS